MDGNYSVRAIHDPPPAQLSMAPIHRERPLFFSQNPVIGVGAAAVSEHDRPDGQRNRNVLSCAAVPKYSPFHFYRLADSHFLRALEFSADLSASGAALGRISGNGAKAEEWTIAFTQRRDCSAC